MSLDSNTQLTATIAASTVPAGQYALRVTRADGTTAQLGGFTVVAGGQANLVANVVVPNPIGNHIASTIYVDYSNTGTAPMPAPLLILSASRPNPAGSGTVSDAFLTLDASLQTSGFWTSAYPAGYGPTVQILASGKTPGVLNPGESVSVPVYYAGWLMTEWNFADPSITFQLGVAKPTDTTAVGWPSLLAGQQPASFSAAAWGVVSANLVAELGTTSGGYVQLLDGEATYLGTLGEDVTDVSRLWGAAVEQADAGDSPAGPTLLTAVDAAISAVGTSLTFGRSYGTATDSQMAIGTLGSGWSTPWQASIQVGADGTVTLSSPGGGAEQFQPDRRTAGTYFAETGDADRLSGDGTGGYLLTTADGTVTRFTPTGQLDYVADANGNKVAVSYDSAGRLASLTASSGASLTLAYNGVGRINSVTDSAGRQAVYGYDTTGLYLTSVTTPAGMTTYAYGPTGSLATVGFADGTHQYYTYDARGRLIGTSEDGGAGTLTYAYAFGQVTTTDAAGDTTSTDANEFGQTAKTVDSDGNVTAYTYDPLSLELSRVTDAVGDTDTYTYDPSGDLLAAVDALGNRTTFNYGTGGHMTSVTDANGHRTDYAYDAAGDLLSTTYADGTLSTHTFDPMGEATSFVDQDGQATSYAYNAAGQIVTERFTDGTTYSYTYDAHDNMVTATDPTGTTTFSYDAADRLTRVTYPGNLWLAFTYDAGGKRTQVVDQAGTTTNYQYDAAGRLTGLTDGGGSPVVAYVYDPVGRLTRKVNGNGTSATYAYDSDGNILHLINYAADGTTVDSRFDYSYDALGNVATEATADGVWTYTYDADEQLVHAVFVPTTTAVPAQNLIYAYDAVGNRTVTVANGVATTYVANDVNEYTSVGDVTYQYDADGNLLSDGVDTYSYDRRGQLSGVAGPDGTLALTRNAFGQVVASDFDGQTALYLNDPAGLGTVAAELSGGGAETATYRYGIGLVEQIRAGTTSFYDFDAVGSTADLTTAAGTVAARYAYGPFGELLTSAGTVTNSYTFEGQLGVSVLVGPVFSMRARAYNAGLGRFISTDPIAALQPAQNHYAFAFNNPQLYVDPLGLRTFAVSYTLTGGFAGGFTESYSWVWDNRSVLPTVQVTYGAGGYAGAGASVGFNVTATNAPTSDSLTGWGAEVGGSYGEGLSGGGGLVYSKNSDPNRPEPGYVGLSGGIGIGGGLIPIEEHGFVTYTVSRGRPNALDVGFALGILVAFPELLALALPVAAIGVLVVGSHDPNDLVGPAGYESAGYIAAGEMLPYRIDFENDPTATAPAQAVTVSDPLSGDLDPSTFQLTGIGWGDFHLAVPAGSQTYQTTVPMTYDGTTFDVLVQAGIHVDTGVVYATFQSLDPTTSLPPAVTAGFLPPEDGTGRGEGYLTYLVVPKVGLATGTTFDNVAVVSFDDQTTIATDQTSDTDTTVDPTRQATLTIDAVAPTSTVAPLPAVQTAAAFPVSWAGSDDAGGSGVAGYDVYVSVDGGPFAVWQSDTTATSATYDGAAGHTYGFYSVATDGAGNVQPTPADAQATTTTIVAPTRFVTVDAKHRGAFTDAAGSPVTVALAGPGSVQLGFPNATASDPLTVTATGTTAASRLTIRPARGTLTLGDVAVTGSLAALTAPAVTLDGSVTVSGTVRTVTLGNVADGPSTISVGGGGGGVLTAYRFGTVSGLAITSAAPVASLTAASWSGGGSADALTAPSAGTVHVVGNFDASVTLTGGGLDLRALIVGGALSDAHLAVAGGIGTVSVGGLSGSTVFAGVSAGTVGLPSAAPELSAAGSIRTLVDRGTSPFADTDIAAHTIGSVSLRNATADDGGTPFGVSAASLRAFFLAQPKAKPLRYAGKTLVGVLTPVVGGDLRVEVL